MTVRSLRVPAAVAGSGALALALLVAPIPAAEAAGPVVCTATGGTITNDVTIDGIRYNIHVFNSSATFTPAQATRVDYLVVGGGGGGGGGRGTSGTTRGMGGGGGGGAVVAGSLELTASGHLVTRGAGGTAGSVTATGGTGGTSSIGAFVTAAGGGGGGAAGSTGPGGNGASGGGGSGDDVARAGGTASAGNAGGAGNPDAVTFNNRAGGGGGGAGTAGANASAAVGGNGGSGVSTSITGSAQTYGGGGGGGGTTAGSGTDGGGNGSTNGNATAGSANRGGGGGGARSATTTSRTGGTGGTGVVIIRYPRFCLNPSPPTDVAFANPTMSWGAPVYVPALQTVSSYTVTYRQSGDTSSGNIYARGSSATSLNITGTTQAACSSNNPGWTCDASITLVSGQSYEFRVFARTASSLGQMSTVIPYTVP